MTLAQDIGLWLWRLLPGNPILVRVVAAGGKRTRHLHARWIYLFALFIVMVVMGTGMFSGQSLAELAKNSTTTFMGVSLVQLVLMSFIAPVFAAGAITQEKDSNTFDILLTTPLSTGQIVIGMLFSRLFFVWALLLSGLPIFGITMIYGGVTTREVFMSLGLAASTGFVTGALAIMIGVARVGTQRTIFSFFMGVAIYLLALWGLAFTALGLLPPEVAPTSITTTALVGPRMSWLAPFHPFLSLFVVIGWTPAPDLAAVQRYGWPMSWLLAEPAYGYMVITTLASVVMILISLFFVRAGQKEGELTFWNRVTSIFNRKGPAVERTQEPRRVWNNPIAWREANTRGSAAGKSAMRWFFIAGGVIAAIVLLAANERGAWGFNPSKPDVIRPWLTVFVWIELAVILLIVTNVAATTLTREKESLTIELLLTTPLTSKYIIAGMLRGLVSFVIPLIAVPTFTILLFVIADLRHDPKTAVTTVESFFVAPAMMTAFVAMAAMIGLYFSLQSKKTVQAVMISSAIVLGASGLLWACAGALLQGGATLGAITSPFTPFTALQSLIDYESLTRTQRGGAPSPGELAGIRITRLIFSVVAIGAWSAITYVVYNNMVRNFDMTVRRQSA